MRRGEAPPGRAEVMLACSLRPPAMGEVNFPFGRQEHVQWPAEGLSSPGAPGQLALRRTCTRFGALTPSLIQRVTQSALHPPPC